VWRQARAKRVAVAVAPLSLEEQAALKRALGDRDITKM
jgi:hypothetical protein